MKERNVRELYATTLLQLAEKDERIVVLDADLARASGGNMFRKEMPERHIQVGVAEQNLIGIAAGMSAMGKIPFAATFACFLSQRGCDQAVNAVAYNNFNVKMCGLYGGLTQEKNGGTHISVEDIAIFRSMPNVAVIVPGDGIELASALRMAAVHEGPVYLRIARGPMPDIFPENYQFRLGRSVVLKDGGDVTLITTGITTCEAVNAVAGLDKRGVSVRHIHMPTIKPIDREEIVGSAKMTGMIVTVENHSVMGGLGSAVTEIVCEEYPVPVVRLGINDRFGETASLKWLMEKHGISSGCIINRVLEALEKKLHSQE